MDLLNSVRERAKRAYPDVSDELLAGIVMGMLLEMQERGQEENRLETLRTGIFYPCRHPDTEFWDSAVKGHPCVGIMPDETTGKERRCACPCHRSHLHLVANEKVNE